MFNNSHREVMLPRFQNDTERVGGMPVDPVQLSKFLSLVLRHQPDAIGLALDPQVWVSIDDLLEKGNAAQTQFSREDLLHVVETSEKKRFSISADGLRIRAAQGHSVSVKLGLSPREPPPLLFHGTATRFTDSIQREGLKPLGRQQVHLSADRATAQRVGQRHGKPAVLEVDALRMHATGFKFYLADNGVWLTDQVPPEFLATSSSNADSATTSRQPKLST
jgi:putative RNA 2'-phosphotransferase